MHEWFAWIKNTKSSHCLSSAPFDWEHKDKGKRAKKNIYIYIYIYIIWIKNVWLEKICEKKDNFIYC